jgi:hypothetical protein
LISLPPSRIRSTFSFPWRKKAPLLYVRWGGWYPTPEAPHCDSASEIPDLGTASHGRKGDNRYLVFPKGVKVLFRKIERANGKTDYEPVSPVNTPCVHFHSGGIYRDDCLISGVVETGQVGREGIRFFERFYRAIRTCFTRVESARRAGWAARISHIGPGAAGVVASGDQHVLWRVSI